MPSSLPDPVTPTERTRLRRAHHKGRYDRATINAILDAMPLCHFGYVIDGKPAVTPTFQWREGDYVYWHASSASRALRAASGMDVCLTVTLLDGIVLARSAFHHSANFRSVMIFGEAEAITEPEQKARAMKAFVDSISPGRWDGLRPMTDKEVKATGLLRLPISEASAKIRTGPPVDDEEDYALPIWAGVVPIRMQLGEPEPDPRNLETVEQPAHIGAIELG